MTPLLLVIFTLILLNLYATNSMIWKITKESSITTHFYYHRQLLRLPILNDDQLSSLTCRNRFFGLLVDGQSSAQNLVDARNIIFERFTDLLLDCNIITKRHTDMYPVTDIENKMRVLSEVDRGEGEIIASVNRMAAPFLGVTSVGIHLLCYICDSNNNNKSLWLAQRASNKSKYPLYWDPTVAGGQPVDINLFQNVIKEAGEEAGINPESVIQNAISTGCLSQMTCKPNGTCMKQSLYYTWDMQVDRETFVPKSVDGEVANFELSTAEELENEVRYGNRLRPAMILVVTDFLMRHGIITPDNEPDFAKIQTAIHRERLVLEYVPQGKRNEEYRVKILEFITLTFQKRMSHIQGNDNNNNKKKAISFVVATDNDDAVADT
eukprot:CAMPEP_0170795890 /NCGR_PEP_ID=MMETSP0733-20121128/24452_1 /TAXON_ID=186038 /ORGANISM="Fragilariopsis kerguelensis, Strain L26-C5" /LENGTH=379 /DNA_ID=CAMNT_0011145983 /DNA_START=11 /DNA_END=1151 /DNA_ORIENTATION=-